jgi:hypothetical protein
MVPNLGRPFFAVDPPNSMVWFAHILTIVVLLFFCSIILPLPQYIKTGTAVPTTPMTILLTLTGILLLVAFRLPKWVERRWVLRNYEVGVPCTRRVHVRALIGDICFLSIGMLGLYFLLLGMPLRYCLAFFGFSLTLLIFQIPRIHGWLKEVEAYERQLKESRR